MMGALLAILVVLAGPGGAAPAASRLVRLDGSAIDAAEADRFVERQVRAGRVAGLAVAVLNEGRVVYLKAFGERDAARHLPLRTDTVMHGASFTKAVFATLVAQLAEEGVIDLDRPVAQALKRPLTGYADYADLARDARHACITPRMLLSHTAGLANYRALEPDGRLQLHYEPGARYAYSGEGFNLLQLLVEERTGRPLHELVRERIFAPLGMEHTSLVWQQRHAANVALAHDRAGRPLGHERREQARAASSMDTTIADFAAFLSAMMTGRWPSAAAKARLLAPVVPIRYAHQFPTFEMIPSSANDAVGLSYGLGFGLLTRTPYGPGYFKEGHGDGRGNYALAFDRSGVGVVLMSNSDNGEAIFKPVLEELVRDDVTPWDWELYPRTPAR